MKKIYQRPIDLSKVSTIIYHLPDGPALTVGVNAVEELVNIELAMGDVCDTSDIDGVVHFFPRGHA